MECGKLTAKLRDAVPVIFIEEGREPKRFKNIEIPEIKTIPYKDFKFDVPVEGQITFKIWFEQGSLPAKWPEARTRQHRVKATEPVVEKKSTAEETSMMEADFNVTGDRRKELVAAIGAYLDLSLSPIDVRLSDLKYFTFTVFGFVIGLIFTLYQFCCFSQ